LISSGKNKAYLRYSQERKFVFFRQNTPLKCKEKQAEEQSDITTGQLTIFDKRINAADSDNMSQHIAQPLWINKIQITQRRVIIMQQYTLKSSKFVRYDPYISIASSLTNTSEDKAILIDCSLAFSLSCRGV